MEGAADHRETNIPNDGRIFHIFGYLQSHKYFNDYKEEIASYFTPKEHVVHHTKNKYEGHKNKTSIHVRRTDYITLQDYHVLLDMDYYEKAIDLIGKDENFLVFSDDIEWCKENFKDYNCEYVEERPHNKNSICGIQDANMLGIKSEKEEDSLKYKKEDVAELFLMSTCENNIVANSSYSWWAAYLNTNHNKKIIAPKNWFTERRIAQVYKDKDNYMKHRVPDDWILV